MHLRSTPRLFGAALGLISLALAGCGGGGGGGGSAPATALGFFSPQPTTAAASASPVPRAGVRVGLKDAGGNFVPGSATITITIEPSTVTGGAAITGTATVATDSRSGLATFPDVAIDTLGTGYKLRASATGLTPATSNAFDVAGVPAIDGLGHLSGGDFVFTDGTDGSADDAGFTGTYDLALDAAQHRLFVSDYELHRVLVFNLSADNDFSGVDRHADIVIGQTTFTGTTSTATRTGMAGPYHIAYDARRDRLFVGDYSNDRVLVYDTRPTALPTTGAAATHVLGQPDFTSSGVTSTARNTVKRNGCIALDTEHERLFVGDTAERVLVFDVSPGGIHDNADAIAVLGKSSFTDGTSHPVAATSTAYCEDAVYDPTTNRLFLADSDNNRILVFNASTLTNGQAAVAVIGQASFSTSVTSATRGGFDYPSGLELDTTTGRLFVADEGNNRVLVFSSTSTPTFGLKALAVFGQTSFITSTFSATQRTMRSSYGVALDPTSGGMFVADFGNNRVLLFTVR